MKDPSTETPVDPGADLVFHGVDFRKLQSPIMRIRRLAKALFKAYDSDVRIVDGDRAWRSGEDAVQPSGGFTASARVMAQDGVLWIADTFEDPVTSRPMTPEGVVRFYAGTPIRLEDGRCVGALCVVDLKPRPYDADLAERLQDVAATLGHECDLARTMRDRDTAMERVERSEQRINLAVENSGMHVFEVDFLREEVFKVGPELNFHEAPRAFLDVTTNIWDNVHPDDRDRMRASWSPGEIDGVHRSEYRLNRTDGKEIWVHTATEMYRDESGRPLRLVGAMQNITERKRAEVAMAEAKEAAEASNRAKSAFLATMSHEIRTPLNGVLGMAQAMAAEDLSEVQRDRLKIIRESGEILLAILNDVLDLSKIEAGKLELEEAEFDIGELASGAHATFAATAQAKGLIFDLIVEKRARGVYRGDPVRVRQILYNLVSNALKFTDK
ncbi:MAG: histidine kinase dimerization/phospho-acceptor domain-containing protein, partial [Caulobacteraceae bacterium]